MRPELEIEYRGYTIRFSENEEVWRCWALDVEGEKLATVKRKIDKVIAASRKFAEAQPAIHVDYHGIAKPVKIASLAEPRKDRNGNAGEPTAAWCMVPGRERYLGVDGKYAYRDVETRQKLNLDQLYTDTAENQDAVAEMQRIDAEIKQLGEAKKRVLDSMRTAASFFHIQNEEPDEKE